MAEVSYEKFGNETFGTKPARLLFERFLLSKPPTTPIPVSAQQVEFVTLDDNTNNNTFVVNLIMKRRIEVRGG